MSEEVKNLIDKTQESIRGARALLKEGLSDFAASRSYYAMFYTAQALLLAKGLSFSSHRAVIAQFAVEFIKSGAIDKRYHQFLTDAFDKRQVGNYGISEHIEKTEAQELISRAQDFLRTSVDYLRKDGLLEE